MNSVHNHEEKVSVYARRSDRLRHDELCSEKLSYVISLYDTLSMDTSSENLTLGGNARASMSRDQLTKNVSHVTAMFTLVASPQATYGSCCNVPSCQSHGNLSTSFCSITRPLTQKYLVAVNA